MVTTRSAETDERVRMLRTHGMRRRYFHDEIGWNARMDTIQAAVLEVKLRRVDAGNARRRELAALYDQAFRDAGLAAKSVADGVVLPWADPRAEHVFHQYVIRAPRRDALRAFLDEGDAPVLMSLGSWEHMLPDRARAFRRRHSACRAGCRWS